MVAELTRHVLGYALHVTDEALYRAYREGMMPILLRYGGDFGYDFEVSKVLRSESASPINRVFTMVFPDRELAARFFSDPAYLAVRDARFGVAVAAVTKLFAFDEPVTGS